MSSDQHSPDVDLTGHEGRVAVLGGGVMGGAIASGLLAAGLPPDRLVVADADEGVRRTWSERGTGTADDNASAADGADVVVVAVKPYAVAEVLDGIAEVLTDASLVVSVAAGVTLATLTAHAGDGIPVVRVMPNTPALVGEGMFVLSAADTCPAERVEEVEHLLSACGRTETVPESQQDVTTAVSGSGPAYLFYVADALIEGAVLEGMPRPVAARLVAQTLLGAATMLRDGDQPAALAREGVTSPGGTTAAGLRELDAGAVRYHLGRAVSSAARRSAELGE